MKLFGVILVVSSFTFIGAALSRRNDIACRQLKVLIELIRYLRRHISYSRAPLWEMLDGFEVKEKSMISFFKLLCDKHTVDTTRERFERASEILEGAAREICIRLGRELGRCPLDEELKLLDRLENDALELLLVKTTSLEKSKRIYNSVFPLVGLVVSILLL